jgi:hypothetical protein
MPQRRTANPTRGRYTYTCSKCSTRSERTVKFEERDDQTCDVEPYGARTVILHDPPKNATQEELEKLHAEAAVKHVVEICGGKLVRAELEETAFTPYSWK